MFFHLKKKKHLPTFQKGAVLKPLRDDGFRHPFQRHHFLARFSLQLHLQDIHVSGGKAKDHVAQLMLCAKNLEDLSGKPVTNFRVAPPPKKKQKKTRLKLNQTKVIWCKKSPKSGGRAMKSVGFFSKIFEGVGGSPKFGCTSRQLNLLMHQNSLTSHELADGRSLVDQLNSYLVTLTYLLHTKYLHPPRVSNFNPRVFYFGG